jgi:hypothetical protein
MALILLLLTILLAPYAALTALDRSGVWHSSRVHRGATCV